MAEQPSRKAFVWRGSRGTKWAEQENWVDADGNPGVPTTESIRVSQSEFSGSEDPRHEDAAE